MRGRSDGWPGRPGSAGAASDRPGPDPQCRPVRPIGRTPPGRIGTSVGWLRRDHPRPDRTHRAPRRLGSLVREDRAGRLARDPTRPHGRPARWPGWGRPPPIRRLDVAGTVATPGAAASAPRGMIARDDRTGSDSAKTRPRSEAESMSSRILVVEDDERIRSSMRLALEEEGYEVDDVASGEEALDHFSAQAPDVTLIDLMLPGMDGFEFCRALRRQRGVPIIMVTARTDTHDIVAGLEAGADDYVTKPFVAKELGARIRALLRRARPAEEEPRVLAFGDLELIPEQGVLRHD